MGELHGINEVCMISPQTPAMVFGQHSVCGCTDEAQMASGLQGRFDNDALDRRQAEQLFREHLNTLHKRNMDGYIALLEKVGTSLSGHC